MKYTDAELDLNGLNPAEWQGFTFREGTGCIECGGNRLPWAVRRSTNCSKLDDEIREMLLAKKPGSEIRKKGEGQGDGVFLRDSAIGPGARRCDKR